MLSHFLLVVRKIMLENTHVNLVKAGSYFSGPQQFDIVPEMEYNSFQWKENAYMLMISVKDVAKNSHHSHAHSLLKSCLGIMGVDYTEDTPIVRSKMGKPSLEEYPNIQYNLSHADGIAACIIAEEPCGIDCERIRPYRENVVRRAFSQKEKEIFYNTPEDERSSLFFRLWTLKESYVKAIGVGISYPMETVEFFFCGNEIVSNIKDYSFRQYMIKNEFIVSSAIRCRQSDVTDINYKEKFYEYF